MTPPLLYNVAPELEAELTKLLIEAEEPALADRVKDLVIHDRCRCGDTFCSSFYTVAERTTPYPKGFRTLALKPGELHLDVLGMTILHIEVLFREDLKAKIQAAVP
jgi:hypothetical protein